MLPSMLSCRCICIRAVKADKLGMFLYPTGLFSLSAFSFCTFSDVSGSPPSMMLDPETALGGEAGLLEVVGDTERVDGGFTATESEAEAAALLASET